LILICLILSVVLTFISYSYFCITSGWEPLINRGYPLPWAIEKHVPHSPIQPTGLGYPFYFQPLDFSIDLAFWFTVLLLPSFPYLSRKTLRQLLLPSQNFKNDERRRIRTKRKIIVVAFLATILPIAVITTILDLYYISWSQADISFTDLKLEESSAFLNDLETYKKFTFTLTYEAVGGFFPVDFKDFTLNVEVEYLNVGRLALPDCQVPGERKATTRTFSLNVSGFSDVDLSHVAGAGHEFKVDIRGFVRITTLITSKQVYPTISKNFLVGPPSINFIHAYWAETTANSNEPVSFHVKVSNQYRVSPISGSLSVDVYKDYGYPDSVGVLFLQAYSFPVSLQPGQSSDLIDYYKVFSNDGNFFLKVYWEETLIYYMPEGTPPRLHCRP
jgi:hypothetical protein